MKASLFNFLFFILLQNSFGQVTGKITTADGQPIAFANVLLLNSIDTSLVKATLTDDKGDFRLQNINPGKYILRLSSIGYQTFDSPIFGLTNTQKIKEFGTQIMKEETKQLEEVVVRAEKPLLQQQAYGTVVNVENSVLTKGSSALDVLERSPGVYIDHQNNSIALNGKSGVMVMVNGKLMRMSIAQVVTLLKGMSANDIEKIELLTTPPSKYDSEGSAGMINMVLKKRKKQGTTGSFSITGGYGWGEKGTGSVNLDHQKGNIGMYSSYTFSHDRTYMDWFSKAVNEVPLLGGQTASDFLSVIKPVQNNHNASIGFDAKLSSKLTIGSSINYNTSKVSAGTLNHAEYMVLPETEYMLNADINGVNRWKNLITSIYAEKKIREGEQINFDIDYLHYKNNNPTSAQSSFIDKYGREAGSNDTLFSPGQKGFANTFIRVGVAKMDYIKQLSKKIKLETGVKATYTRNASVSGIESLVNGAWVSRHETTNNIVMKEGIEAMYTSINAQINPTTNLVAGARYEYSHTRVDNPEKDQTIANRKLGKLFPGIFLSHKLNDKSELQLSYTKRISRPTYNDLASFIIYTSPTAVETGNPMLRPTITDNLKLGYNYCGYSFSLLLSKDNYPIVRYQITSSPTGDLMSLSPQNLIYQNNLTFQTNLPYKVKNWWNMSYGFVGGLRQFKEEYTVKPVEKTYFGYSANFSESFKLPGSFFLEISGWYNSSSYDGSKKVDGFGALNAGVKKELKKNGGTFQLSVTDFLKMINIHSSYGSLTEEAFSLKSHVTFNTESSKSQIIKFTYTRSFGDSNMKSQRKQDVRSEDEKERVRKD